MVAIELVEFDAVVGAVLRPIPPIPVAALGDQQLFIGQLAGVFGNAGGFIVGAARGQQKFPGLVIFLGPDPDVEIRVDPGARKNSLQRLGFKFCQRLGNGERFHIGVGGNAPIEFPQKRAAVFRIPLPGVFAIENDGHQRRAISGVLPNAVEEMAGGIRRAHPRIFETDQVAEVMIAEDHAHLATLLPPDVRLIGDLDARIAIEGAAEHSVIAGRPGEARFVGQGERVIRHRAFRRPQAHRRDSHFFPHVGARAIKLLTGVLRILKPRGERYAGMRHGGFIGIAQQRQDGMVEGRGGYFNLTARAELAIHRQNPCQRVLLHARHGGLVGEREVAALADQFDQDRIAGQQVLVEPDQLVEHLQIAQILRRKRRLPQLLFLQLAVPRVAVHQRGAGLKEILEHEIALGFA